MSDELIRARDLHNQGDYVESLEIVQELLEDDPEDVSALFLLVVILISTNKRGLAYQIATRVLSKVPHRAEAWVNYGKCQPDNEEGWGRAEECFIKALELDSQYLLAMTNLSSLFLQQCKPEEAETWANRALKIEPDNEVALSCLSFVYLFTQKWKDGFHLYDHILGKSSRPIIHYNDVPRYEGTENEVIMVNGEQGIGDELIYSSFLKDIAKKNKVVYDCMPRLKTLMERSFKDEPNIHVSGQRWSDEQVLPDEFMPTCSTSIASLGQYVRETNKDFTGEPYLKADSEMRASIRGLLDSISDKPKVGIAWTGGSKQSRMQFRQYSLERFTPFLRNMDVDFVSLQYKDPSEEIDQFEQQRGIKIHHFPWITEIKDYDLTAALVSELDLIISVPTSVTQLAGALGTAAWVLVPPTTGWLFHPKEYVWAKSVDLFHAWTPKTIEKALKMHLNKKDVVNG